MIFRLLSYNIQRGLHCERLLRLFDEAPAFREADVIAIQEASFRKDGRNVLDALAEVLSPEHAWTYRTVMTYPDKEYGNGFVFRRDLGIVDSYSVPLPQVPRLKWHEKRKTEGGAPDTKSAFVQGFSLAGRCVRIANVHLDFSGGSVHRHGQLNHLLLEMAARGESPGDGLEIICGDFNTVGYHGSSRSRRNTSRVLDSAISRGFVEAVPEVNYTSDLFGSIDPADPAVGFLNFGKKLGCRFRQKTDHILVRGGCAVPDAGAVSCPERELFEVSDHLPIQATIEFDSPG